MIQLLWLSLKNFRLLILFFILSYFIDREEKIFLFTLLGELPSIETGLDILFMGKLLATEKDPSKLIF